MIPLLLTDVRRDLPLKLRGAARWPHRAKPMRGGDAARSRTYLLPPIYPPPLAMVLVWTGTCAADDDDVCTIFIYV